MKPEDCNSMIRATVAKALAQALIDGIDNAQQEGHPLTLLQQTDMATMSIMSYDNAIEACQSTYLAHFIGKKGKA